MKALIARMLIPAALIAAGAGYYVYTHPAPCSSPVGYDLGSLDSRFGENRAEFLSAIAQAAKLWDDAAGKQLFAYMPGAELSVNLVYDSRQQTTDLGKTIDSEQEQYNEKKSQLDALESSFATQKQQYETVVSYWNAHGGAPPNVYQELQTQKQELDTEAATINSDVAALNALAANTNQKVDAYNANAGADFNEGEYIEDDLGKRINVYEFTDQAKLVRVLAHELGHALGLEHNQDPSAIMYAYNKGTAEKLTAADIAELDSLCGIK